MSLFNKKIFVIAEMANAHEGNLSLAKKITEAASKAGADAIKFQIFKTDELLETKHPQFNLFKNLEMNFTQWKNLIMFAKKQHLLVFADVFGMRSAKLALKLNVDGLKIHTSDITNPILLNFLSNVKNPILLSTAGSFSEEISNALTTLLHTPKELVLMHGFQGYPTQLKDLNLKRITELKKMYNLPVGLMDHVSGESKLALIIPLLGLGFGATVIEKHITLNRSEKGTDYYSALNPIEFKELVSLIHSADIAQGTSQIKFSTNEIKYRLSHKKNTIAKNTIKKNTKLKQNLFEFKRTKKKLESVPYYNFEEKLASKNIPKDNILTKSMIKEDKTKVAAILACRVESGRLFGKPIQTINNIPIIQLLINQIKTAKSISEIVLAISEKPGNEIFVEFAKKNNLKYVLGDDRDVLKRLIDGAMSVNAKIIFRVTSENPFIFWQSIDKVIKQHINGKYDFSFLDKVPIGSGFEIINLEAFEKSHKLGTKKHRSELCSLYIHEHQKQFKINKFSPPLELQKPNIRLTVDTPEDLIVARIIYNKLGKKGKPIPLKKIIQFLEKNLDISQINSDITLGVTRIWN